MGRFLPGIGAILMGLGLAAPAMAEIYRYVSKDGVIYYTNRPRGPGGVPVRGGALTFALPQSRQLPPAERHDVVRRVRLAAEKHGIDPLLVKAVAKIESDFNPQARSHKDACGVMQLIPGTAQRYGVGDIWDLDANIDGGVRYLRDLLQEFRDISLALAAYNAGENAVRNHKGIPPYAETRDYVRKVMATYRFYQKLEGQGPLRSFRDQDGVLVLTNSDASASPAAR